MITGYSNNKEVIKATFNIFCDSELYVAILDNIHILRLFLTAVNVTTVD